MTDTDAIAATVVDLLLRVKAREQSRKEEKVVWDRFFALLAGPVGFDSSGASTAKEKERPWQLRVK